MVNLASQNDDRIFSQDSSTVISHSQISPLYSHFAWSIWLCKVTIELMVDLAKMTTERTNLTREDLFDHVK